MLTTIQHVESTTTSDLATRLSADKGQISRSVSELESLGLIERVADAADGRIKRISLTAEGRERVEGATGPLQASSTTRSPTGPSRRSTRSLA